MSENNITEEVFKNTPSGYLDSEYQEDFVSEVIMDTKFGNDVIEFVETDNFENESVRSIVGIIKNIHEKYGKIPTFKDITVEIKRLVSNEVNRDLQLAVVDRLKEHRGGDPVIQDRTTAFFLQQNMLKTMVKINKIVAKGDVMDFYKCQDMLSQTLMRHNRNDIGTFLYDGLERVYDPDYRNPIPLGMPGLDQALNGGIAPGELMIVIAPLGTGKTTMSTYVANHMMRNGKKVLQMFFEDTPQQIKQKHAACLHNLEIQELSKHKDECLEKDMVDKETWGQNLLIKKFDGANTHVSTIRSYINKVKTIGFIPDFIIIDYIDCIMPEKGERYNRGDEAEKAIVKQVEAMVAELQVGCLTFIQSNRNGVDNENVGVKDSGGSISRAQIGHVICTLSRTDEQQQLKLANFRIKKSRVGSVEEFIDIVYDNGKVQIDIPLMSSKKHQSAAILAFEQKNGKTLEETMKQSRETFAAKQLQQVEVKAEINNNPTIKELEEEFKAQGIKTEESFLNQKEVDDIPF